MLNPTPLSRTNTTTSSEFPVSHPTVMVACGRVRVYLMALDRKLANTCFKRFPSPSTSGSGSTRHSMERPCVSRRNCSCTSATSRLRSMLVFCNSDAAQPGKIQKALDDLPQPLRFIHDGRQISF